MNIYLIELVNYFYFIADNPKGMVEVLKRALGF